MKEVQKIIEQMVFESLGEASAVFMSDERKGVDIIMPTDALESIGQNLVDGVMGVFFPKKADKHNYDNDKCICGHFRIKHGKSFNINFTDGKCKECKCLNFMMK